MQELGFQLGYQLITKQINQTMQSVTVLVDNQILAGFLENDRKVKSIYFSFSQINALCIHRP